MADSNLFSIDLEAIGRILADANVRLLQRRDELLEVSSRSPEKISSENELDRAIRHSAQLDELLKDSRGARLSDGRVFQNSVATVKAFFVKIDKPTNVALEKVKHAITTFARESETKSAQTNMASKSVGTDFSGDTILSASTAPSENQVLASRNISLVYTVENFDRATVDLEALRPYLTDRAILLACNKHLSQKGTRDLRGANYKSAASVVR